MTLPPDRIERAARALCAEGSTLSGVWRCQRDRHACRDCLDEATKVLESAYPELASGSHWLAPWKATDAMFKACGQQEGDRYVAYGRAIEAYAAMRDAYLSQPDKDKT